MTAQELRGSANSLGGPLVCAKIGALMIGDMS